MLSIIQIPNIQPAFEDTVEASVMLNYSLSLIWTQQGQM